MAQAPSEPQGNDEQEGKPTLRGLLNTLFIGLSDMQFRSLVTTRMLPTIYALGLALFALLCLYLTGLAFGDSWQRGLLWLVLLGPALFVGLALFWRVILEFLLTIFRMAVYVQLVTERTQAIGGMVEGIDTDLPRIQFWKSRRRKSE